MKIEKKIYEIIMSNTKESFEVEGIEAELIMMALMSKNPPKNILLNSGEMINTSYYVGIREVAFPTSGKEYLELNEQQEKIHKVFLQKVEEIKLLN